MELHKNQRTPVFSRFPSYVSEGYSWTVRFIADKTEYLFSLCCKDEETNPAHLFFGAYVIDALDEELRCILSERGGDFLVHDSVSLFGGVPPDRVAACLRKLAEQRLEEDLYRSHGILFDVIDCYP